MTFGPSRDELYRHEHRFPVIDRPHRLLLDTTETRGDGPTPRIQTEFTFEERDRKTLMTMIQRGLPTAAFREEHRRGVPRAFARFERHIRRGGTPISGTSA